jgi:putative SOS response-associated peptidase YedK
MCGRYSLITEIKDLEQRFSFHGDGLPKDIRFNIAPTQNILAITNDGFVNQGLTMKWGLIPYWSQDMRMASRMINARSETLEQRNAFRQPLLRKRCLILADGFYEWTRKGNKKTPMRIKLRSGNPFGFAGLWDAWKSTDGEIVQSCTIITTEANELIAPIHNRMPAIINEEFEETWLDINNQDIKNLKRLLYPYESTDMEVYEISTLVNSPRNDSFEIIARVNS